MVVTGIDPKKDPRRRCRRANEWPVRDRRAWDQAFVTGDVLDPGGPGAHWSPYTKIKIEKGYGRFLTWLDFEGRLDPDACPEDRVSPGNVAGYVGHLQELNASMTVLTRIEDLTLAMKIMAPKYDRTYLKRLQSVLRAQVTPARDNRARVQHSGELRNLGQSLIHTARNSGSTPLRNAIDYRDGLMILLLAHAPLRRKNFTALRYNDHFVLHGEELWIDVPGELLQNQDQERQTHRPPSSRRTARLSQGIHHDS